VRTPRDVSESYWAAECRRDVDAVLTHYHDDAVYEDGSGRYEGLAAIRRFYEGSASAYPGLELTIVSEIAAGDTGALGFEAILTDTDGHRWLIRGVNLVTVRDGHFVAVRSYEDPPARLDEVR
jgi:ketosteroid isomerase-like protein